MLSQKKSHFLEFKYKLEQITDTVLLYDKSSFFFDKQNKINQKHKINLNENTFFEIFDEEDRVYLKDSKLQELLSLLTYTIDGNKEENEIKKYFEALFGQDFSSSVTLMVFYDQMLLLNKDNDSLFFDLYKMEIAYIQRKIQKKIITEINNIKEQLNISF